MVSAHAGQKLNTRCGGNMGKRSTGVFQRRVQDYYPTPEDGVVPLLDHLTVGTRFYEPCAGNGHLIGHLEKFGHRCVGASDIANHSDHSGVIVDMAVEHLCPMDCDQFITNPPWSRPALHSIISHLMTLERVSWLLLDADWAHTKQAVPYLTYCRKIVSVGRLKWIPQTKHVGKDNCAWYLFSPWQPTDPCGPLEFFGRQLIKRSW